MNAKQYLILMSIPAVLTWLTWGFIMVGIGPSEAGFGILFLFYVSLAIALACTISVMGFVFRNFITAKKTDISASAKKSFRQAMLLSILSVGLLYFQSKRILNWWTIILFIGTLAAIESFLISYKTKAHSIKLK
jgi:hypothetical protein